MKCLIDWTMDKYLGGVPAGTKWQAPVLESLTKGTVFTKHGRGGFFSAPKAPRIVWVKADLSAVCYGKIRGEEPDGELSVSQCKMIRGVRTPGFLRSVGALDENDDRISLETRALSLDTTDHKDGRTLDLEARSASEAETWYTNLKYLFNAAL